MNDETNDWYSAEQATFGDRVAGARNAAGMDQKQLARRLGVKLQTVRDWEDDVSEPRSNKLQMLSGVLNVSMSWLLTGEGEGVSGPDEDPVAGVTLEDLVALRADLLAALKRLDRLETRLKDAA
ncbi:helix-turn-helix domain-containing protein [Shimia ponticola]|uniref:helix-turn-helix domain-containing protein n=1 Tax=Shimia ponticola TaxID=2582893 RepID=UPI0011BED958|nr:helix-turn-helix transcriptional regulator [Shimia ponticola]